MTKLSDVVRGIKEYTWSKEDEKCFDDLSPDQDYKHGYNSLAQSEVVVGIPEIANIIHKGIYDKDIDEEHPVRNLHIYAIAKIIATAIESGSIISLKEEE